MAPSPTASRARPAGRCTSCSATARLSTSPAATWRSGGPPSPPSTASTRSSAPPATTSTYAGGCGRAPFHSLYEPAPSLVAFLPQMPEWHLMTATLGAMAGLSVVWSPLRLALPLFVGAIVPPIAQAWLSAADACFPDVPRPSLACLGRRLLTAALHLLQPIARLRGRLKEGLDRK